MKLLNSGAQFRCTSPTRKRGFGAESRAYASGLCSIIAHADREVDREMSSSDGRQQQNRLNWKQP